MVKRFEMTKEMENALLKANVSEEKISDLQKNGLEIQELSLDDLDAVSGGDGTSTITVNGMEMSALEFNALIMNIHDTCGFQTAYGMFQAFTGDVGVPEYVLRGDMKAILNAYWKLKETHSL